VVDFVCVFIVEEKPLGSFFKNMSYEIVTLDEMIWDGEKQHFFYECPCGDVFTLTPDDVRAGEEIARCASCSLYIEVEYDSSQAEELLKELCV